MLTTLAKLITAPLIGVLALAGYHFNQAPQTIYQQVAAPAPITQNLGAFNPTAAGTYYLEGGISQTATTLYLSSFLEPVSNIPYSMAYLNSAIEYAVIDPNVPGRSEIVSFTGITQNADGSATITGITRGLSRSYPFTASTTIATTHAAQAQFILSDSPQVFAQYAAKQNNEIITGSWSFPAPTSASSPATQQYVLQTITGTSTINFNKTIVAGQASGNVSTGTIVYYNSTAQGWAAANAATTSNIFNSLIGIAQSTATNGNPISSGVLVKGLDTTQSGLTIGTEYYLSSTTPGTLTTSSTSAAIGFAQGTTAIYFDPTSLNATYGLSVVQTFTATTSSTWTKPAGAGMIQVIAIGGGGGGGNGAGNSTGGSGGGGGGAKVIGWFPASSVSSSVSVTVGAGGTAASPGASSTFGGYIVAGGGNPGANGGAGTIFGGAGGSGMGAGSVALSTGGVDTVTGGASGGTQTSSATSTAGGNGWQFGAAGGGSGSYAGNTAGKGGNSLSVGITGGTGGTGGSSCTGGNTPPNATSTSPGAGGGGGGGSTVVSGTACNGGNGGLYGGGGGGGGTDNQSGSSGGTGGTGGNGVVQVITYF